MKTKLEQPWRPAVFDVTAHFEPSTHFEYNRNKRRQFDQLARRYKRSTWMLGSYGGTPRLRTDLQGIGVATRIEVGRLAWGRQQRQEQLANAFDLFTEAHRSGLASGPVERVLVRFPQAPQRPDERQYLRQAWKVASGGEDCTFLGLDENQVELGQCVVYQPLLQYLREDGLYHRAHRSRIEEVERHLQEEVGRYENHRFFVHPQAPVDGPPALSFGYTGQHRDRVIEAFVEGYTGEQIAFWTPEDFAAQRQALVSLKDYERASRRFGNLTILIGDMVKCLPAEHVCLLYLFLNDDLQLIAGQTFNWQELASRQAQSQQVERSLRHSSTYLENGLEILLRLGLVQRSGGRFGLVEDFVELQQVYFYPLGEYRKRSL